MQRISLGRLAVSALLGLGLFIQTGCKEDSPKGDRRSPQVKISLLKEGDVEELRTTFAAIAAENTAKVCKRPALRAGPLLSDKADEDMLVLLAEDGPMQACYNDLDALETSIENEDGVLGLLRDASGRARALDDRSGHSAEQAAAIVVLQKSCSPLAEVLSKAVSHENSCSPRLPGRNGQGDFGLFLKFSKAAVMVSRQAAAHGRRLEAVQLLLDTLRFGQDLSRGGTTLLEPMLAHASHGMLRPELDRQIDSLSLDELRKIESELNILIESHPHYSEYFDGEHNNTALYMLWPAIEAEGWQPPGGYPFGETSAEKLATDSPVTEETMANLVWIAIRDTDRWIRETCSKSESIRACAIAADSDRDKRSSLDRTTLNMNMIKTLNDSSLVSLDNVKVAMREEIVKSISALPTIDYSKFFVRIETMRIALIAQQNKVQSLIAAKQKKPCPVPLGEPDTHPRSVIEDGEIRLHRPQWMVDWAQSDETKKKLSEALVFFRCS